MAKIVDIDNTFYRPEYRVIDGAIEKFQTNMKSVRSYQMATLLQEDDEPIVTDGWECEIEAHDSEDVDLIIPVITAARGKMNNYLISGAYCGKCQKYYIDQYDYEALTDSVHGGRPCIYAISGNKVDKEIDLRFYNRELHEKEYKTLTKVDRKIEKSISLMKSGYGNEERIKHLRVIQNRPYEYHAFATDKRGEREYFIGANDEFIMCGSDSMKIVSKYSDSGRALINPMFARKKSEEISWFSLVRTIKDNIQYGALIDEEIIAENIGSDQQGHLSGEYDDTFLRLLLGNRAKSRLPETSMIEKQFAISDAPLDRNIIVQGCAGAGKTVVMLYRIAVQRYLHPQYDFENAVIVTPNENFEKFIYKMIRELGLENIKIKSVEDYYIDCIRSFSDVLVPREKIYLEMRANQALLDYVYSGNFVTRFEMAFNEMADRRDELVSTVLKISDKLHIDIEINDENIVSVKSIIKNHIDKIEKEEELYAKSRKRLNDICDEERILKDKIDKYKKKILDDLPVIIDNAFNLLENYTQKTKNEQILLRAEIGSIARKIDMIKANPSAERSVTRTVNYMAEIKDKKIRISELETISNSCRSLMDEVEQRKGTKVDNDDLIEWLKRGSFYVNEINQLLNKYQRGIKNLEGYEDDLVSAQKEADKAEKNLFLCTQSEYPESVREGLKKVWNEIDDFDINSMFKSIYDKATEKFIRDNDIKRHKRVYRFDLYARLLFCKYFYTGVRPKRTSMLNIDEGQDISINEFRLFREVNDGMIVFNVYGDTNQLLKRGSGISDWAELTKTLGAERFDLDENFRNTNQITEYCNKRFGLSVKKLGIDGHKVDIIHREDLDATIQNDNYHNKRVAIIIARNMKKEAFRNGYIITEDAAQNVLDGFQNEKINLLHVDEAKGVEYDRVYVILKGMMESEGYIACTRAMSHLIVVEES